MSKYEVTVKLEGTFEVEAETEDEACQYALEQASDDPNLLSEDVNADLIDEDENDDEDEEEE